MSVETTPDVEARIQALEDQLAWALQLIEARASFEGINEAIVTLGRKAIHGNHTPNYLGKRFCDYELAVINVKQVAYYIGRAEAEKVGAFAKMNIARTPTRERLNSKLCVQRDFDTSWYYFWLKEMCYGFTYHRKFWEFCYIAQNLYAHGGLAPGKTGVGFGCGEEPLASLFAKYGAFVKATDLDPREFSADGQGWTDTGQHAASLEKLLNRNVCPDPIALERVTHEFVNMNRIPRHFENRFDFCWSAGSLEHIGSLDLGLKFIENSLETLKPGGIAVHTTEYNFEDGETIDHCGTVLYQTRHLLEFKKKLEDKGYVVNPFDFDGGNGVLDGLFDLPPWPWETVKLGWHVQDCFAHIKRSIGGFPCTSVAITITKPL